MKGRNVFRPKKLGTTAGMFILGSAFIFMAAGCASETKVSRAERKAEAAAASVRAKTKPALIDDSGSLMGIITPPWLAAYVLGGNTAVESLKDFKSKTCFVVTITDESRDFALNWVNGTEGPRQVAAKIANTLSSDIATSLESEKGSDAEANLQAAAHLLNNVVFSGLSRDAEWWQQVRYPEDDREEYRAYALYTIDKKMLDQQVAGFIQRFLDDRNRVISEAEKAIYQRIITTLLEGNGVSLSAGEPEADLPEIQAALE